MAQLPAPSASFQGQFGLGVPLRFPFGADFLKGSVRNHYEAPKNSKILVGRFRLFLFLEIRINRGGPEVPGFMTLCALSLNFASRLKMKMMTFMTVVRVRLPVMAGSGPVAVARLGMCVSLRLSLHCVHSQNPPPNQIHRHIWQSLGTWYAGPATLDLTPRPIPKIRQLAITRHPRKPALSRPVSCQSQSSTQHPGK